MKIVLDFDRWTLDEAIQFEEAAGLPYWEAVRQMKSNRLSTRVAAALAWIPAHRADPDLTWELHIAQSAGDFVGSLEFEAAPLAPAPVESIG